MEVKFNLVYYGIPFYIQVYIYQSTFLHHLKITVTLKKYSLLFGILLLTLLLQALLLVVSVVKMELLAF